MLRKRWGAAVSRRRWVSTIVLYMVALVASLTFMGMGIYSITGPRDAKSLWSLGMGVVSETALINDIELPASIGINNLFCIFLANLPQLIFSILYFQYNAIFTCMLAAKEWSEFGVRRKPVRVSSSPRGCTTDTVLFTASIRI
ncbi:hypothetical protein SAPIO_CDS1693 [Scedosporium apiospermum]|uniref:Uncharacterized protein n=1 Tax=Pseudallescheria apiosperma TaxID=563466 RepID=A0A084GDJ1_PSEDA|nr:uncharacterized protein SAPIO_CDS1693 [Scedosporium apiospermum]KEZ45403.1 hypothetical protein SAPIO_CDS1693 [Scedosporium apiospermum]